MAHKPTSNSHTAEPSRLHTPTNPNSIPTNHTTIHTKNVTLTINVATYFWIIDNVYCKTDWQPETYKLLGVQPNYADSLNATITATFPQVPKGTHTVTIYANTHDSMHAEATLVFTKTE